MPDEAAAASEHGKHGREQYFIEGEGSFATAGARGAAADEAPPFRFSRVGPRGKRLDASIRGKVARAMTAGPQRDGRIPAGFTYLGQFVDHDLTFDATTVAFGENITPADLLQGRSPTLDLDSLYGFGPDDEVSTEVLRGRPDAPQGRHHHQGAGNLRAREGFDVPRVGTGNRPRRANIPDRRNDENLAVAQHHAAFIRFHNRVVDRLPASVPAADRFRNGASTRGPALPMDAEDGLPDADRRPRDRHRRVRQRPEGVRGRRRPVLDAHHAGGVLRWRLPARALDGARGIRLECRVPRTAAGRCSSCSTSPAPAAPWAVSRRSRATGSPTGAGSTASARSTARTSIRRRASPTTPAASTPRWSTRSPTCRSARSAGAPQTPGRCGRISRSATSPGPGCSSWPAASRWPTFMKARGVRAHQAHQGTAPRWA